jgi:Na+-driven multidrug efflux pump
MRNIMVFSAFAVFIPAWFVLQPLGNDGLWLAFLLFLASRGIGMHSTTLPSGSLTYIEGPWPSAP